MARDDYSKVAGKKDWEQNGEKDEEDNRSVSSDGSASSKGHGRGHSPRRGRSPCRGRGVHRTFPAHIEATAANEDPLDDESRAAAHEHQGQLFPTVKDKLREKLKKEESQLQ